MKSNKLQDVFWDVKKLFRKHGMILFQVVEDHEYNLYIIWNGFERLKFVWFHKISPML